MRFKRDTKENEQQILSTCSKSFKIIYDSFPEVSLNKLIFFIGLNSFAISFKIILFYFIVFKLIINVMIFSVKLSSWGTMYFAPCRRFKVALYDLLRDRRLKYGFCSETSFELKTWGFIDRVTTLSQLYMRKSSFHFSLLNCLRVFSKVPLSI